MKQRRQDGFPMNAQDWRSVIECLRLSDWEKSTDLPKRRQRKASKIIDNNPELVIHANSDIPMISVDSGTSPSLNTVFNELVDDDKLLFDGIEYRKGQRYQCKFRPFIKAFNPETTFKNHSEIRTGDAPAKDQCVVVWSRCETFKDVILIETTDVVFVVPSALAAGEKESNHIRKHREVARFCTGINSVSDLPTTKSLQDVVRDFPKSIRGLPHFVVIDRLGKNEDEKCLLSCLIGKAQHKIVLIKTEKEPIEGGVAEPECSGLDLLLQNIPSITLDGDLVAMQKKIVDCINSVSVNRDFEIALNSFFSDAYEAFKNNGELRIKQKTQSDFVNVASLWFRTATEVYATNDYVHSRFWPDLNEDENDQLEKTTSVEDYASQEHVGRLFVCENLEDVLRHVHVLDDLSAEKVMDANVFLTSRDEYFAYLDILVDKGCSIDGIHYTLLPAALQKLKTRDVALIKTLDGSWLFFELRIDEFSLSPIDDDPFDPKYEYAPIFATLRHLRHNMTQSCENSSLPLKVFSWKKGVMTEEDLITRRLMHLFGDNHNSFAFHVVLFEDHPSYPGGTLKDVVLRTKRKLDDLRRNLSVLKSVDFGENYQPKNDLIYLDRNPAKYSLVLRFSSDAELARFHDNDTAKIIRNEMLLELLDNVNDREPKLKTDQLSGGDLEFMFDAFGKLGIRVINRLSMKGGLSTSDWYVVNGRQ